MKLGYPILEELMQEYVKGLDLNAPIKRDTNFETIWQRAHTEDGVEHLNNFFKLAESEASRYV